MECSDSKLTLSNIVLKIFNDIFLIDYVDQNNNEVIIVNCSITFIDLIEEGGFFLKSINASILIKNTKIYFQSNSERNYKYFFRASSSNITLYYFDNYVNIFTFENYFLIEKELSGSFVIIRRVCITELYKGSFLTLNHANSDESDSQIYINRLNISFCKLFLDKNSKNLLTFINCSKILNLEKIEINLPRDYSVSILFAEGYQSSYSKLILFRVEINLLALILYTDKYI